ncbi:DMT family transporter [Salinisphaera aquimarina]|uniref:DMT family transporter n=1 Tax=Salinisphaera aquimarina TaxID=2094031 RepID=A0ABV7EJ50_9GAMM
MTARARGIALTAAGVLVLSPDSILIRLLGADLATTLFWRGLAMGVGLFAYIVIRDRGTTAMLRQLRRPQGWGLGVLFALSNILFVTALANTSVADTLGCLATASIFAALLSTVFLRERAPLRVWVVSAVIALGLFLIAVGGAGSGFGRLIGVATAAVFGATFVVMRATGDGDTLPGLALGGALIALASAWPASPLSLDTTGLGALAAMAVVLPLAFGLIGRGPRYLPAPEVSLLMLLETVFGTLWAWLWLAEAPTATTLLAIAIILGALAAFYARQAQVNRLRSVPA